MSGSEDNKSGGRWTAEEHENFLIGLSKYGREWKKIQSLIATRTPAQIRSHAQKHFLKLNKDEDRQEAGVLTHNKRKQDMMSVLNAFENTLSYLKLKRERHCSGASSPMTLSEDDSVQRRDELIAAEVLMKMSFECH
jgi:SHAQKYF class myb-like DNA-binding protein